MIERSAQAQYMSDWQKTPSGKESLRRKRENLRGIAIERLGGRCSASDCRWVNEDGTRGCTDIGCLQVDHKRGGGRTEMNKIGTHGIYRKIKNGHTSEYQLLCANCNWLKRVRKQEHLKRLVTHGS